MTSKISELNNNNETALQTLYTHLQVQHFTSYYNIDELQLSSVFVFFFF